MPAKRKPPKAGAYSWADGSHLKARADAQKVGVELEQLGDHREPDDILELAKNPELELHKLFTWDDTKAAHERRLDQARQVASHLCRAVIIREDLPPITIRALVSVVEDKEDADFNRDRYYTPVETAASSDQLQYEIITDIESALRALQRKLEKFSAYFQGFNAAQAALKEAEKHIANAKIKE
jgi:hypothetical protein